MTQSIPNDNYYLDYFLSMIDVVFERYSDILHDEDRYFIEQVRAASQPAIRLLVRLYMRKGPNFLVAKLKYMEIPSISDAIEELETLELIESNPQVFAHELIDLLPVATSRQLFSDDTKIRKAELFDLWLDDETLQTCKDWGVEQTIITPLDYESYRRIQLMYFGNEYQDLTEFILEDIGLFKYESYQLGRANRLFESADELDQLLKLNELSTDFYLASEAKDWASIPEITSQTLELKLPDRLHGKWFRFINRLAYRLEQLNELDIALRLFQSNDRPPSRERQVRILDKQGQYQDAFELLTAIELSPKSSDETQFHRRFINKLRPKLSLEKIKLKAPVLEEIHAHWLKGEGSVEQQACVYFENTVWLENKLPLGIFGLIHWSVVFADIPGVWHHPFQAAPADLNEPEFLVSRSGLIDKLHQMSHDQWKQLIEENWAQKNGIRNPFVSWQSLDLKTLFDCFDALTFEQWLGLFRHLLSDLKQYRSGFPDLFQQRADGSRFIEIKGPGDKLQDNQIAWLEVFNRLDIPAVVCYVTYD